MTAVETNVHTDVHDESDSEEIIETENFPEYDDPFKRVSRPFWRQGWYDRKTGVFMGHDGGRYAPRVMWLQSIRRYLRNSPPGPRKAPPSIVPQESGQQEVTPGIKRMGGNTKVGNDKAAIPRAWKACMEEQRKLSREVKSHGLQHI